MFRIILFFALLGLISCKRYQDPDPFTDPRLTNYYCNRPTAINYNWNFPGIANDSVCIYPAQIYHGTYLFYDTVYNNSGLLLSQDSFLLHFLPLDSTRLQISGFCSGDTLEATANRFLKFTLDTVVGAGQLFCSALDTIAGTGMKSSLSDSLLIRLDLQVNSDTGIYIHRGSALKK